MTRILEGKNRASPSEAASFIDKVEELMKEKTSEQGTFMAKCKAINERIKEVLDDAKSQGVAKKLVKSIVSAREHEAKAKALRDDLEDEDQKFFVDIRKVLCDLADTPLGAAAMDRQEQGAREKDPVAAAAEKAWGEPDPIKEPATSH